MKRKRDPTRCGIRKMDASREISLRMSEGVGQGYERQVTMSVHYVVVRILQATLLKVLKLGTTKRIWLLQCSRVHMSGAKCAHSRLGLELRPAAADTLSFLHLQESTPEVCSTEAHIGDGPENGSQLRTALRPCEGHRMV